MKRRKSSITKVPPVEPSLCSFVHPLQPELYKWKMAFSEAWTPRSHEDRWVLNFARDGEAPRNTPARVVDLVASWLAHIKTADLMYAAGNVDAAEEVFQRSFHEFLQDDLKMEGRRECTVKRGRVDLVVEGKFGIELLIRASRDNQLNARDILTGDTKASLIQHAARVDAKAAVEHGQTSYEEVVKFCPNNYVTVLPATVTTTSAEEEYGHFQTLIAEMTSRNSPLLSQKILVAVATFGWASWDVFLWDPELQECVRFQIKRQRLMYKVLDGKAEVARQYYPRPQKVWVQELKRQADGILAVTGRPFKTTPVDDSVDGLAERILPGQPGNLVVHKQDQAGAWIEITTRSHVLYENLEDRPYGFLMPEGVTFDLAKHLATTPGPATVSTSTGEASSSSVLISVKLGHDGEANWVRVCPDNNDAAEAAIRKRLRLAPTARIELTDQDDCGISIDSVTDEGTYTVSVLD